MGAHSPPVLGDWSLLQVALKHLLHHSAASVQVLSKQRKQTLNPCQMALEEGCSALLMCQHVCHIGNQVVCGCRLPRQLKVPKKFAPAVQSPDVICQRGVCKP